MARNKYPEETRHLIIDTAARLYSEKGYDHTSIQDIIDHLGGLSKGAIYHHFKSKEDIMMAVADKMYLGSESELFRVSAFNPAQKEMFEVAPDMLKNPQLLVLYLRDSVQREATEMVWKVIEEGIEDGSIQTDYPKQLAEVIMLLGNVWLNPMIYHCGPEEMIEKVKFYHIILQSFGINVIDDKVLAALEEYAAIYQKNKNS